MYTLIKNGGERVRRNGLPSRWGGGGRATDIWAFVTEGGVRQWRKVEPIQFPWLNADGTWDIDAPLWPKWPEKIEAPPPPNLSSLVLALVGMVGL